MSLQFIEDTIVFDSQTMVVTNWLKDQMPLTVITRAAPMDSHMEGEKHSAHKLQYLQYYNSLIFQEWLC